MSLVKNKGVCRTAPATLGLLIIVLHSPWLFLQKSYINQQKRQISQKLILTLNLRMKVNLKESNAGSARALVGTTSFNFGWSLLMQCV